MDIVFYLRMKTTRLLDGWGGIWTAAGCAMNRSFRKSRVEPSDSMTSVLFNNLIGTKSSIKYRNTLQDLFYCAFDLRFE
jgi:hypothetical protein